ncbi:MAG TPA: immunoglobulin domain-containing protein, partial [Verrucomicrobiae bacterium]
MITSHWRFLAGALLPFLIAQASAQTWQLVSAPTNATAVGAGSGNTLYAGFGNSGGVYRTTDNGVTWSAVNTGLLDGNNAALTPTALYLTSGGRVLRGGADASWNNRVGSPVFYTDDGANWTEVSYPFATPGNNPGGNAVTDFEELGGALYFSDTLSYGVWKSTNNGLAWDKVNNGLPLVPFSSYTFERALAKSGSTLFTVDPNFGPYRTTDGGASWQASHNGIVAVPSGLFGDSWPGNDIHHTTDGTVYTVAGTSVYKTTDAGNTWSDVGAGVLPANQVRKLASRGNTIYAAAATTGGYQVFESTDGGAGWQMLTTNGLTLSGLDVLATTFYGWNNALYLAGPQGLFRLDVTTAARIPLAPVFVAGTGNIGVNTGNPFTLTVQYGGSSTITYQWYKDGVALSGATGTNYTDPSATAGDAGVYAVVASNAGGSSSNVVSTVTVAPRTLGSPDYSYNPGYSFGELFNWNGFLFSSAQVTSLARQPDGKAIVTGNFAYAGRTATPVINYSLNRLTIARFNPDGTVDSTFNAGTGGNVAPDCVVLQPDGKMIVTGDFTTWNGAPMNRVVRLNADGSIDRTFNAGTGPNARVMRA